MAKLKVGNLFSISLPDGEGFAYGYINFSDSILMSNIFKQQGEKQDMPENISNADILIYDMIHDRSPFLPRMKKLGDLYYWRLSKKFIEKPLSPKTNFVLHGASNESPKIFSIIENKYVSIEESGGRYDDFPIEKIHHPIYYSKLILAKLKGKEIKFDNKIDKYIIS